MNNVCEAGQHGEFNLMYMEPIQKIKTISDFYPIDRILLYDKLGINPLQKDCFSRKRVHAVRVVMEVQKNWLLPSIIYWVFGLTASSAAMMYS